MSVADENILTGKEWRVHKFGGTSVADAECFLKVAHIIEDQISNNAANLAVVVSAMGGKPKTTDLLLSTVSDAANREEASVQATIRQILDKHASCLELLFQEEPSEKERLVQVVQKDLRDIEDILKTVSLMKWQAERISELVSGTSKYPNDRCIYLLVKLRLHI